MFRTFVISTRRLLAPKTLSAITCDASSSGTTTVYDVRRNGQIKDPNPPKHPLLMTNCPSVCSLQCPMLTGHQARWVSTGKNGFTMPDPAVIACNMISMLKCVDLQDMKDAPPPAFWSALVVGGSQLVCPFLELIGGYSSTLTLYQLYAAAMSLGFRGGQMWGLALSDNPAPTPTWETMGRCFIPSTIAVAGLLTPYPVGFVLAGTAMVAALYIDLKSCIYPPWACAIAVFMTLTTLVGLLSALSAYVLFHNKENKNKKKENNQPEGNGKEEETEDDNGGDNKSSS